MREPDRESLAAYLTVINEERQTTRIATEEHLDCPDLAVVRQGHDEVRNMIGFVYDGFSPALGDAGGIHETYWSLVQRAKDQAVFFGAADHSELDDYFAVDATRSADTISAAVRSAHPPGSIPNLLLDSIEHYVAELQIPVNLAARITMTHLARRFAQMAADAHQARDAGARVDEASTAAFARFAREHVPRHAQVWAAWRGDIQTIGGKAEKPGAYPEPDINVSGDPMTITMDDARGLMSVYPLQKMSYSRAELELGHRLAKDARVQASILSFQLAVVAHSLRYLEVSSNPLPTLPITEFFVLAPDVACVKEAIAPNPKLIQVICNNILPGIAAQMIMTGSDVVTADHIRDGVGLANRKRVFHLQIGQFNNADTNTQTVELGSFFPRTCPAMPMLKSSLERWLPQIFEDVAGVIG